jgi:hypothetical protein
MFEFLAVASSAVLTAAFVNFVISVKRRHQAHNINVNIDHVLRDVADLSLSVDKFVRQIEGHC